MNIYEAMMSAADYIEANPEAFDIHNVGIPYSFGMTGCALGWTGHYMGFGGRSVYSTMHPLIGISPMEGSEYFRRMEALDPVKDGTWFSSPLRCARVMRLYAKKYHSPLAKPLKTDAQLVQDLMRKITTERIPEDA